jgi:hypothetical protein
MARRHKPQPEPRRPTRSAKLVLDQAAAQIARSVKEPKPGASNAASRKLAAEQLIPRKTVQARPQPEPVETPAAGITFGGKCKRCDQSVRIHMKATEGTFQLMNFYSVRCVCKGTISVHLIGPSDHTQFEHLDPNNPRNARVESIDGVGKENGS